jgi:Flp pilus assembly protein TadG
VFDRHSQKRKSRSGAATVELCLVLPFLVFLAVAAVDFARAYYFSIIVANCARNGAIFGSNASLADTLPYESIEQAALAEAQGLATLPIVESRTGIDAQNRAFVEVTVHYLFKTVTNFPGIPNSLTITRTVRMPKTPEAQAS